MKTMLKILNIQRGMDENTFSPTLNIEAVIQMEKVQDNEARSADETALLLGRSILEQLKNAKKN